MRKPGDMLTVCHEKTKQQEIREGIIRELARQRNDFTWESHKEVYFRDASTLLNYLHSQGAVLKVDKPLPRDICQDVIDKIGATREDAGSYKRAQQDMLKAGYVATESLVEE